MNIKEQIIDLEILLHDPVVRADINALEELLDLDFFEYGTSGKVWTRESTIAELPLELHSPIIAFDFEGRELSPTVYQLTYKTTRKDFDVLRSSIWKLTNGKWRMVFHQGTRVY